MANASGDAEFAELRHQLERLLTRIKKSSSVNVNSETDRADSRALVQHWFREVRPHLESLAIEQELIAPIDSQMQTLLKLANGRNRKSSYLAALERVRALTADLDAPREIAIGQTSSVESVESVALTRTEDAILSTLDELVPSAALSYQQAISDLADGMRVSYRGPANELRSTVWDVLDRLAPDDAVVNADGFKLEKGQDKPTHKQKARFILRSRLGGSARQTPEATLELIEQHVGALGRAIYTRSSVSTHVATTRGEIEQLKMYVDSFLCELLEVHQR